MGEPRRDILASEPAAGAAIRTRMAGFARTLRANGFKVGLAETRDALVLARELGAGRVSAARPAFKALFCGRASDWQSFDEIFDAYWLGHGMKSSVRVTGNTGRSGPMLRRSGPGPEGDKPGALPDHVERGQGPAQDNASGQRGRREGASTAHALEKTDFRHIADPEALARTQALAERLARLMRTRITRRERSRRKGRGLDLRRTIHRSIPAGGTPLELVFRQRKPKPLRLVILLDASGSMSLYASLFIRFMHGVLDSFREAEAFLFHTRLVHVSDALRERDPQRAVDRMALMSEGVGGGTRIGESLATFNRWHASRVITSRTALMIVSDGFDTGEPDALAREMRTLRRRCHRIVWLNPMIGWQDYAPEARGLKAALPYVDLFAPAHNLESLAALEPYLARI